MRSLPLSQKLFRNAYVNVMRLTDRLVDGYYRLAVARPDSKFSKFVIGRKNVLNYIRRDITDSKLRDNIATAGRQHFNDVLSYSRFMNQIETIYRTSLNHH